MVISPSKMTRSFWLALIFSIATSAFAEERAVQLLLPSRRLEPTSTFELRFATEMVSADQVGKAEEILPLIFASAVDGQFILHVPSRKKDLSTDAKKSEKKY